MITASQTLGVLLVNDAVRTSPHPTQTCKAKLLQPLNPVKSYTIIRNLGLQHYQTVWQAMQEFTASRDQDTADELWITEHYPVYTLGLNGKIEHLLQASAIPVVACDRGGQITYHGPGQLIIYLMADLKRIQFGPRQLVTVLENAVINTLAQYGLHAFSQAKAPGVYIDNKKIAALGLRIKRGCSYHGLSLNNQMDLSPFLNINPCGYPDLQVCQLRDFGIKIPTHELAIPLAHEIIKAIEA